MKVNNYGDMLAKVIGKECLGFVMFGSYQGEWVALLENVNEVELWKGYYGSCPGCDFIEAERDWKTDEIPDDKARGYFKEDKPFLKIPKEIIPNMSIEDFHTIFPANIRDSIYDYEEGEEQLFKVVKKVR